MPNAPTFSTPLSSYLASMGNSQGPGQAYTSPAQPQPQPGVLEQVMASPWSLPLNLAGTAAKFGTALPTAAVQGVMAIPGVVKDAIAKVGLPATKKLFEAYGKPWNPAWDQQPSEPTAQAPQAASAVPSPSPSASVPPAAQQPPVGPASSLPSAGPSGALGALNALDAEQKKYRAQDMAALEKSGGEARIAANAQYGLDQQAAENAQSQADQEAQSQASYMAQLKQDVADSKTAKQQAADNIDRATLDMRYWNAKPEDQSKINDIYQAQKIASDPNVAPELKQAAQERAQQAQVDLDKARASEVDPSRYWADKSTGNKVLSGLAVALGAVGAGLNGGQNMALAQINRAVDNDIAAQLGKQQVKGQAAGFAAQRLDRLRQTFQDDQSAALMLKMSAMDGIKASATKLATAMGGQAAQVKLQAAIAAIDQGQAQLAQKLNQTAFAASLDSIKTRAVLEAQQASESKGQVQVGSTIGGAVPIGPTTKAGDEAAQTVTEVAGRAQGALAELKTLTKNAGAWDALNPMDTSTTKRIKAAATALRAELRTMATMGVRGAKVDLSDDEKEIMGKEVPDNPAGLKNYFTGWDSARLDALGATIRNRANVNLKPYNYQLAPQQQVQMPSTYRPLNG
jgi:hypothetical protein